MAPRKQTKAAGSVVANANGDASSPSRKRKIATATTKPVIEELKQLRTGLRRGKAEKIEVNDNDMAIDASPPKKARGGKSKIADPKPATETKSGKSNKVTKAEEMINNNANEKMPKQTAEKKTRATKIAGAMAKKAGTGKEEPTAKSKAKESVKKPKNNTAATENGAGGDAAEEMGAVAAPTKRTRGKVMEKENAMPAVRTASATAKVPKKRKKAEEKMLKATGDAEVAEEEAGVAVPDKKLRGKQKKAGRAANEQIKPKGRARKNTAKVEVAKSSKEIREEEPDVQDVAEQEDSAKAEKNIKKGNAKKVTPRRKRNATALPSISQKTDDAQMEDAAMAEADVQENEKVENVQTKQPKKRNTSKANAVTKEKMESKGKQRKGQATTVAEAVDEKETAKDTNTEDDAVEKMNAPSETQSEETDTNEVAQSDNTPNKKEVKGEANKAELPESVESAQPIKNEILESEVNTSVDKDEN